MSQNFFDVKGRVAIVTGAGGALGSSAAIYLSQQGVKVVCLGRTQESIDITARSIMIKSGQVMALKCDVLNKDELQEAKDKILSEFGKIDILLNAAGGNQAGAVVGPDESLFDMSMEAFQKVTELNLNGSVLPSLVFGEVMKEQGNGVIVNYSSMAVNHIITRVAGYSASKAAVENFTKWMAVEMAKKYGEGVRVNAISPGFFIGKQNRSLLLNDDESLTERGQLIINKTPFGRFGRPDELNGAIHWLCSDASNFVTGTVVTVDGGFSAYSGV